MSAAAPEQPVVFWDGCWLPLDQARLPVHDAGLVWGATITELARTYSRRLFRWPEHLARFRRSCDLAEVPLRFDEATLTHAAEQLVARNARLLPEHTELALVMFATPGEIGYYLGEPGGPGERPPRLVMHTFPLPATRYEKLLTEGAYLAIATVRHVPESSIPPEIKHRSRLFWWRAERAVQRTHPGASALLLDHAGRLTETAAANVFLVRDGVVRMPRPGTVLPGVTAAVVVEGLRALGIPVESGDLTPADLVAAEEAFLTCTTFGIAPVRQIDHKTFPVPGPVVRRLRPAWSAWTDGNAYGRP